MGRKPYPKYLLTVDEHNMLQKLSAELKVDTWFCIAGSDVWIHNGEVAHKSRCNGEYDEIYDAENKRYISLQYGLKVLNEAFEADEKINSQWLTPSELRVYKRLLKKLGIIKTA